MRVAGHWVLESRVRLFVAEQAAAGVLVLAAAASEGLGGPGAVALAMGTVLALQGALYLADLYERRETAGTARWSVGLGAGLLAATAVWAAAGRSRPGFWFGAMVLSALVLVLLRSLRLARPRRVVVFGTGGAARALAARLVGSEECALVGFVSDGFPEDGPVPLPLLLARDTAIDEVAARMDADVIALATPGATPDEALARARSDGRQVVSAAGLCERYLRRTPPELLGRAEFAYGDGFVATRAGEAVRRGLDVLVSGALLIAAAPLLALVAALVKLDSQGPVFYSQERVGRGGRTYRVTKVRSMRVDAEAAGAPVWAQVGDPRVTRVGAILRKTRVDELPQLFAVLAGHMSLVGPRPERPYFVAQLEAQLPLFALRQAVKPGLTGWAQISYPYGATIEDARAKLEFDLYWIRHRSTFLYLSIAFHTARTVLTARGAR